MVRVLENKGIAGMYRPNVLGTMPEVEFVFVNLHARTEAEA